MTSTGPAARHPARRTSGAASPLAPRSPGPGRHAVLVLVWLLATALAATVAWWAVTAVGGTRSGDGSAPVSPERVAQLLAEQAARDGTGTGTDVGTGDGTDVGTGPGGAGDATSTTPAPSVGTAPAPTTPAPTTPGTGPGTVPDPAVAAVARTWDVTGGQVAAVCTGATIGLLYATPAAGWSVEVDGMGPQRVRVDFSRDGEDSRLRAQCVEGVPQPVAGGGGGTGGGDDDDGDDGDDGG